MYPFFFPTSFPVLLALYGEDYDDNDGDDNDGSPVLLALYVRSTSKPKSSCESWGKSRGKPRPTSHTQCDGGWTLVFATSSPVL